MPKNKKLSLNSGIQTYNQIFTNNDEVCIPSLSSILLAVKEVWFLYTQYRPKKYMNQKIKILAALKFLLSCLSELYGLKGFSVFFLNISG